jgi:hypothetical protein
MFPVLLNAEHEIGPGAASKPETVHERDETKIEPDGAYSSDAFGHPYPRNEWFHQNLENIKFQSATEKKRDTPHVENVP